MEKKMKKPKGRIQSSEDCRNITASEYIEMLYFPGLTKEIRDDLAFFKKTFKETELVKYINYTGTVRFMFFEPRQIIGIGNVPIKKGDYVSEFVGIESDIMKDIKEFMPRIERAYIRREYPFIFELKSGLFLYVAPKTNMGETGVYNEEKTL